jgi:FAD/FMN-containing dehydrogenase
LKSYAAIPHGGRVRLAKRTSNLFRFRQDSDSPGLDVSGLDGVIEVDAEAQTAEVQGMCTYEDLVDATLPHDLIPLVVPQLRTITLGGAVTGLGIESTSFRNGLPHESVLEMDVMTGAGEIVTCKPGDALFDAFPNSYGSLGYATRLKIELERVPGYVELTHERVTPASAGARIEEIIAAGGADLLDGVVFGPEEAYLTLGRFTEEPGPTSDYTGMEQYYRSIQSKTTDRLTTLDYLWRWDTDWFWCSNGLGLGKPRVRRLWPRRWRRSDVYHHLIALDQRLGFSRRLDRLQGRPERERVIQDIEVPADRLAEFLSWFQPRVELSPVWLCPLRQRDDRTWPTYPLEPRTTYVNVGFWGTVWRKPGSQDGDVNRAIEAEVTRLEGHKSLYSDAYYDEETFNRLYGTENLTAVRSIFDPESRLTDLYEKVVTRK